MKTQNNNPWMLPDGALPPQDPAFPGFQWSVNVEIKTTSGEIIPNAYYRFFLKSWSVNASMRDIPASEVAAWRYFKIY